MTPLDLATFDDYARRCAPTVSVATIRSIAKTESALRPHALSVNYPKRTARNAGVPGGYAALARQPRNQSEAVSWARQLVAQGHTVSIGLVQVSSENLAKLGHTLEQAFDPCTNLALGARLLGEKYQRAVAANGPGQAALVEAISRYNSGSPTIGFANGYVSTVLKHAGSAAVVPTATPQTAAIRPGASAQPDRSKAVARPTAAPAAATPAISDPFTARTGIAWKLPL